MLQLRDSQAGKLLFECRGERQNGESRSRVEVVLAGVVDHPEKALGLGVVIAEPAVDLEDLKILRAFIGDADDEGWDRRHDAYPKNFLTLSRLRPTPWASYQWISARTILPSSSRTEPIPLSFRQRPRP